MHEVRRATKNMENATINDGMGTARRRSTALEVAGSELTAFPSLL